MKNKKIIIIFTILLLIILIGGYFGIQYVKKQKQEETTTIEEYTPEEEISDEQLRQTIVTLYFMSKETKEVVPEARLIDIKELMLDPYNKLVNLLIEGPKNEKQERLIPENTKLIETRLEGDCIILNFSSEFLNYDQTDEQMKEKLLTSIENTMVQLTEVNQVKILVDGNEV